MAEALRYIISIALKTCRLLFNLFLDSALFYVVYWGLLKVFSNLCKHVVYGGYGERG